MAVGGMAGIEVSDIVGFVGVRVDSEDGLGASMGVVIGVGIGISLDVSIGTGVSGVGVES